MFFLAPLAYITTKAVLTSVATGTTLGATTAFHDRKR